MHSRAWGRRHRADCGVRQLPTSNWQPSATHHPMFRGIFVTGTDTNVGKTVVSAALMLRYRNEAPLRYWKPIQTGAATGVRNQEAGTSGDDDTAEVARLSHAQPGEIFQQGIRLPHP